MSGMTLLERSSAAGICIALLAMARPVFRRFAPRWTLPSLWTIVALRLLSPVSIALPILPQTPPAVSNTAQNFAGSAFQLGMSQTGDFAEILAPASVLPWIWAIGAGALAALFLGGYLRVLWRLRGAMPVTGIRLPHRSMLFVSIRKSDKIQSPIAYGIVRRVIVLPEVLVRPGNPQLDCILAHESAHIKSFGTLRKSLLVLAVCLHWFNPLVWLMLALANRDMEISCDEAVLSRMGGKSRAAYANTLLDFATTERAYAPLTTSFGQRPLEERIRRIMTYQKKSALASALALVLILLVGAAVATTPTTATSVAYLPNPTIDWTDWFHVNLLELGAQKNAEGYAAYDGKIIAAVAFEGGGSWYQVILDPKTGKEMHHRDLTDVIFLLAKSDGEKFISIEPMAREAFETAKVAAMNKVNDAREANYRAAGLVTAPDGTRRFNGKIVLGINDDAGGFWHCPYDENKKPRTSDQSDPNAPCTFLVTRYDGDKLVGFDEVPLEVFVELPMIKTFLEEMATQK